jgi:hypothetical protein
LWESETATDAEAKVEEVRRIHAYQSNAPGDWLQPLAERSPRPIPP